MANEPLTGANGEIVVMPNTGAPAQSETSKASAAALERLQSTGSVLPAGTPPQPGTTPDTPIREVPAQPRASDGTFGRPLPGEEPKPGEAPAKPADSAAPPSGPDAQKPEEKPAEGERTPEEIAAEEAARERAITLTLADGSEVDLDLGDPQIAAVVRSQMEAAREADTIRQQAEQSIQDVLAIRDSVQIDPVGFVMKQLKDRPAGVDHLVLALLTQPDVWERLKDHVTALGDPNEFRTVAAEQRAARAEYREQAEQEMQFSAKVQENVGELQRMCGAMTRLVANATPEQQGTIYNDMLRDLQSYADRQNLDLINPDDVPLILSRRLATLGLDPTVAAAKAHEARTSRRAPARSTRAAAPITPRPATPAPPAPRPAPNGKQFVASVERRKAVAIPAGGAGSPNVSPDLVPPPNADGTPMTIAQTTAWHRAQVAKGNRGLVPAS